MKSITANHISGHHVICKENGRVNFFNPAIPPKLTINQPNDVYEQEADAMADKVMRMQQPFIQAKPMPITPVQRKCAHCEKEEKQLHRKEMNNNEKNADYSLESYVGGLNGSGQALPNEVRNFYEPRFGYNFSNVKVHTDAVAAKSAQSINALAYTSGNNIVFNSGQYSPDTDSGKRLLGHELTHVVQQQTTISYLQRQLHGDEPDFVDQRDGAPNAKDCGSPASCPATFCKPYKSENLARSQRDKMMILLLAGIGAAVDSKVVPLWSTYLMGGSAAQDLTGKFGADFTASPTTTATTIYLITSVAKKLKSAPPVFPAGSNELYLSMNSLISSEISAINTPGHTNEMNFNYPSDIAGNIAGGIGADQSACRAGARPSPFNDERIANGTLHIVKNSRGDLIVNTYINYTVKDTIDLCPGNCGTSFEQFATVAMSQFEATGISGDVPFELTFPAITAPFIIPNP